MAPRGRILQAVAPLATAALLAGCIDQPPDPLDGTVVFRDAFTAGVTPWAFADSKLDALSVDSYERFDGQRTVRIDVPRASATPGYAGGAWLAASPVDLSRATALTFWARAARPAALDQVGLGLDFTTDKRFQTATFGLPLTTEWTRHRIPIPDPSRMTPQLGLFWFAATAPSPYAFSLADVRYLELPAGDLDLQPSLAVSAVTLAPGKKMALPYGVSYADFDGTRRSLDSTAAGAGPAPAFLDFTSSNHAVASVDGSGTITAVAVGSASISARLAGIDFPPLAVTVVPSLPSAPTAGPPDPTLAAPDVISLFSGRYTNAPGVNYYASWSNGGYTGSSYSQVSLGGNTALRYTGLHYAGVDFSSNRIDASGMSFLHVDAWTADATKLGVKLVGFPASGGTVEAVVSFSARTTPPILPSQWVSIDIPLSRFGGVPLAALGQLLWLDNAEATPGGDEGGTFFIDNVYFHK